MKRGVIALAALALVGLVLAGNALVLSPRMRARAEARDQVATARQEEAALRATLAELQKLASDTTTEAELARLGTLIPSEPDLAGFIRTMNDLAAAARVDWSSLTPAPAVANAAGGPVTIPITVDVEGTFFQVLDYLKRLEDLERLVVVDALDVAASGAMEGTAKRAVNLRGRTVAASAGPAGGAPVATAGASAAPVPTSAGSVAAPARPSPGAGPSLANPAPARLGLGAQAPTGGR